MRIGPTQHGSVELMLLTLGEMRRVAGGPYGFRSAHRALAASSVNKSTDTAALERRLPVGQQTAACAIDASPSTYRPGQERPLASAGAPPVPGQVDPQRSQTSTRAPAASPGRTVRFHASKWSTRSSAGCGTPLQARAPSTPSMASSVGLTRLSMSHRSLTFRGVAVLNSNRTENLGSSPGGNTPVASTEERTACFHAASWAVAKGCRPTDDLELDQLPHRLNSYREAPSGRSPRPA